MSLINIAHPGLPQDLLHKAKWRRLVFAHQIMPAVRIPYPQQYESTADTQRRKQGLHSPLKPADER